MQVFVVGAGAMGCLYAAAFHRSGCAVTLVDANPAQVEAINRAGLVLETRAGREVLPLPAALPADASGTADLILLFTKVFHTAAALRGAGHLIGPETHVLTLQNGLGNDERVAAHVPRERVLVGISELPADLVAPGEVHSRGEGGSKLYPAFGGSTEFAGAVCELLTRGGLPSKLDPEIQQAIWSKAIFNATMNPLCALTRRTPGFLGRHAESRELIATMVAEGVAVAHASGVPVAAEPILALTEVSVTDHANHEPSMLQDLKAGRRTEIDAINGAIVAAARAAGITAPVTETYYRLIKLEEAKIAEGDGA